MCTYELLYHNCFAIDQSEIDDGLIGFESVTDMDESRICARIEEVRLAEVRCTSGFINMFNARIIAWNNIWWNVVILVIIISVCCGLSSSWNAHSDRRWGG